MRAGTDRPAPLPPRPGRRGWKLSTRIAGLSLGLLLLVQLASFTAINGSIVRNARLAIADELEVGERLLLRLLAQNAQKQIDAATLLAADYGFRSAVSTDDDETITSALENHSQRIGASTAALLGIDLQLRASTERHPGIAAVTASLASRTGPGQPVSALATLDGRPIQFVLVPMKAPRLIGWVLMGFAVDRMLALDLRALSSLHMALLVRTAPAPAWRPIGSTLDDGATARLAASGVGAASIDLSGGEFGARTVALAATGPTADEVRAVLLRSVDEAVAPYREMQLVLAGLTLFGLIAFAIGSLITARRVTTPLRTLVAATERLGGGDFETPLGAGYRADEIGELAHAFEHMRVRIAGQQHEMVRLAYWDTLTGLPNRAQFRDRVREAIERTSGTDASLAVIMLDLDRFKHVNDVLGYRVGDLLLRGVAERLQATCTRDGDVVARLSGDEFAVLLPRADAALARSVAARIEAAFEQPLALDDQTVDIGAGIGIAGWPAHPGDAEPDAMARADALIGRAEIAMYAAKRRRDGALLYDPSLDVASSLTLSLLSDLRRAIEQDEFRLYLQPKVALDNGRLVGAEVLIRWQHPARGLVPPAEFIPFAEQTGFIRAMTLWVFEQAAVVAQALQRDGIELRLSINLSTRDLLDPALPDKFAALLLRHSAAADTLCLEITESAIMDDPQRAQATLLRLRAIGFKLSIDDFGTGYSSLAYLKRLPVDELKIDRSFVMAMEHDPDDAKIVRSTIDLAHNLGLRVVAEGVENGPTMGALRELDCDEAQGFHIARPMPARAFAAWCERRRAQPPFEPSRPSLFVH